MDMKFEKVSKEQFEKDCMHLLGSYEESWYDNICIPERSTSKSAGYDFRCPLYISSNHYPVRGDNMVLIPTGIKAKLDDDKVLFIVPRSSMGNKGVMIGNTLGVIDSDYYNNISNEGDIIISLYFYKQAVNLGNTVIINPKEKIAQGVILPYYTTYLDNTKTERTGGIGSTGKY